MSFQHAMECGYGTAVFLILMSSSVFVIRGEKASVWGSVYLDEFGEEDIDLRSVLFITSIRYVYSAPTQSTGNIKLSWVYNSSFLFSKHLYYQF